MMSSYYNPKLAFTKVVDASAESTWSVVSKLSNVAQMSPSFFESSSVEGNGKGAIRTCIAPNNQGVFKEEITHFDHATMTYRYQMIEGMIPANNVNNAVKVVEIGPEKSIIIWTTYHEFIDNPNMTYDEFKGFIQASVAEYLGNLKITAEQKN